MSKIYQFLKEYKSLKNHPSELLCSEPRMAISLCQSEKLTGQPGSINTISFNPLGDRLLTGNDCGGIYMWDRSDYPTRRILMVKAHHSNIFASVLVDREHFVSAGNDAVFQYAIVGRGKVLSRKFYNHHTKKILSVLHLSQSEFVSAGYDGTVRLFDVRQEYKGTQETTLPFINERDLKEDSNQKLDSDLLKFKIRPQGAGGGPTFAPLTIHEDSLLYKGTGEIYSLSCHPSNRYLIAAGLSDSTVRYLDLRALSVHGQSLPKFGFNLKPYYRRDIPITSVTFHPSGDKLAISAFGKGIHVMEASEAEDIIQDEDKNRVEDVLNFVSTLSPGFTHRDLFDTLRMSVHNPTGQVKGTITYIKDFVAILSPKNVAWFGDFILTGSDQPKSYVFDSDDGHLVNVLFGHKNPVNCVAVHGLTTVATSGGDDYSLLYNAENFLNRYIKPYKVFRDSSEEEEEEDYETSNSTEENQTGCMVQ